jgi:hypothetical protein
VVPIGQTYEAVLTVQVTAERFCLRFYYSTKAPKDANAICSLETV